MHLVKKNTTNSFYTHTVCTLYDGTYAHVDNYVIQNDTKLLMGFSRNTSIFFPLN